MILSASFADEIAHTRNYLDLMKDRYEHQFTYAITVDKDALKADGLLEKYSKPTVTYRMTVK